MSQSSAQASKLKAGEKLRWVLKLHSASCSQASLMHKKQKINSVEWAEFMNLTSLKSDEPLLGRSAGDIGPEVIRNKTSSKTVIQRYLDSGIHRQESSRSVERSKVTTNVTSCNGPPFTMITLQY